MKGGIYKGENETRNFEKRENFTVTPSGTMKLCIWPVAMGHSRHQGNL